MANLPGTELERASFWVCAWHRAIYESKEHGKPQRRHYDAVLRLGMQLRYDFHPHDCMCIVRK